MRSRIFFIFSVVVSLTFFISTVYAEIVVVAHSDNPITSLTKAEVKKFFLKKMKNLPGGGVWQPIDLPQGDADRVKFYQKIIGKTDAQIGAYWAGQVFSGKSIPPLGATSTDDMLLRINQDKSAISYTRKENVSNGVKILYAVK